MKHLKSMGLLLAAFVSVFFSCEDETIKPSNNSIESQTTFKQKETVDSKLDLSTIDFSAFDFDFTSDDAIIIQSDDKKRTKDLFVSKLNEILEETKKDEYSQEGYLGLNFNVVLEKDTYFIYPIKFVIKDGNLNNRAADCPSGMSKFKTCYDKNCVAQTLGVFGSLMEVGDSFEVLHGTLGVKICASPGLVQRAQNYISSGQ